jgi:hypothetical protein
MSLQADELQERAMRFAVDVWLVAASSDLERLRDESFSARGDLLGDGRYRAPTSTNGLRVASRYQITKSPNHQITKSPNHQITRSPNHQITKSPNYPIRRRTL